MKLRHLFFSLLLAAPAFAADIRIENVWIREPAPGQTVVGGFLDITSQKPGALIGASSPVAGLVELHEMKMDKGVMLMRPLQKITLPKGQTVTLQPGGLHLMLEDLKQPLKAGDKVPLTLKIQRGGKTEKIKVSAEVRTAAPASHPPH